MINNSNISNQIYNNPVFKILHLHSDPKFIFMTKDYDNPNFENTIIFLGNCESARRNDNVDEHYNISPKSLKILVDKCQEFDAVVIYHLDNFKAYIANSIHKDIIIFWRLFGSDVYRMMQIELYSEKTKYYINDRAKSFHWLSNNLKRLYSLIKWRKVNTIQRRIAIARIDYVIMISKPEYSYISSVFQKFPNFIHCSYEHHKVDFDVDVRSKSRTIIVGHSRSKYNNHHDVIDILKNIDLKTLHLIFLFSYGEENKYTSTVRSRVNQLRNATLLEEYLSQEEFLDIYKRASALVINSFRQLAGANIIIGIKNGVKIYMNKNNLHYHILKEEGFHIFEISQLNSDINRNRFRLTDEEAKHNINILFKKAAYYTKSKFQSDIINCLEGTYSNRE